MSGYISQAQNNAKFRVVLDAGHGGNDFGATYHGYVEKNNALNVVLKVGRILEKDAGTQVIYTRKTDVFIPLDERADMRCPCMAPYIRRHDEAIPLVRMGWMPFDALV